MRLLIRDLLLAAAFGTILGWQLWERSRRRLPITVRPTPANPSDAVESTTQTTPPSLRLHTLPETVSGLAEQVSECAHKYRPTMTSLFPGVLGTCKWCGASASLEWIVAPAVPPVRSTLARQESPSFVPASTSAESPSRQVPDARPGPADLAWWRAYPPKEGLPG